MLNEFLDARALRQHGDQSVTLIVSAGFPWFNIRAQVEVIKPLLLEYLRVLKPGGQAVLLVSDQVQFEVWDLHREIAAGLGFRVEFVQLREVGRHNLLLTKPEQPKP